ncbi:MAG: ATP-binding cassette domain-containing protein [Oceanospirillales bacterium]|nr:ATP-binding cassette domain-containing protein [Oceanospirillales bacterium]
MTAAPIVELKGLALKRGDVSLLESTDLALCAGERLFITGPSGCGKSTLLRRICALESGSENQVMVYGRPVSQWVISDLRRTVAYLPQIPVMVEGSVRDNLRLALSLRVYSGVELPDDNLREGLASLDLDLDLGADASRLSPGQKARVALLQRLLLKPDVMLCDEPIASLDSANADRVIQALQRAGAEGMAQIIVSHQPLSDFSGRCYQLIAKRLEANA